MSRASQLMQQGYHCGPTVLRVMWETTDLGTEDLLWASVAFSGGIGAQREAVCGAISGAAVYLGLRYRVPLCNVRAVDMARDKSTREAAMVVQNFKKQFGAIICQDLIGIDFSDPVTVRAYRDSGLWLKKCDGFVQSVIDQLYGLEKNQPVN